MKILQTYSLSRLIFPTVLALSFFAATPAVFAVNDVQVTDNTDFQTNTSDTAVLTTITAAAGGQVTNFDVESNFIDITLDNSSSVTFTVSTANRFFKITKQSGSNNYTVTPTCPTTSATLAGTGAQVILRLELTSTDTCSTTSTTTPPVNNGGGGVTYGGGGSVTYVPPILATTTTIISGSLLPFIPQIFDRNLYRHIQGADVMLLQMYLNNNGYILAQSSWGSPGHETNYFGPRTQASVIEFQSANTIHPAVGFFGPITRSVMNACLFLLDPKNAQYAYFKQIFKCSI